MDEAPREGEGEELGDCLREAVRRLQELYMPRGRRRCRKVIRIDELVKSDLQVVWGERYRAIYVNGHVMFRLATKSFEGGKHHMTTISHAVVCYSLTGRMYRYRIGTFMSPAFERVTHTLILLASDPEVSGGYSIATLAYTYGMTREYSVALAVKNTNVLSLNMPPSDDLPKILRAGIGWAIGQGKARYRVAGIEMKYVVATVANKYVSDALGAPHKVSTVGEVFTAKRSDEPVNVWLADKVMDSESDITVYTLDEVKELIREWEG